MLTLITGTPRAGKTLLSTWEIARLVPGSTVEATEACTSHGVTYRKGDAVPRHLFSNIHDLLIDHTFISSKDLECWHTWAQPGDVIMFDEVQEVWRPRGLGVKVPPEIAALETHGHMGVDLVLITQHPMLVDPNIRRLVNQHLHVRRLTYGTAMVYEWDHCENPGATKTCIANRVFFHRRKMYALYKSATLHTKPKVRPPAVLYLGLAAVAGLLYAAPNAYNRMQERFSPPVAKADPGARAAQPVQAPAALKAASMPLSGASAPALVAFPALSPASSSKPAYVGCVMRADLCRCYGSDGLRVEVERPVCLANIPTMPPADLAGLVSTVEAPVLPQPAARSDLELIAATHKRRL
jgi:zona occludens toxin